MPELERVSQFYDERNGYLGYTLVRSGFILALLPAWASVEVQLQYDFENQVRALCVMLVVQNWQHPELTASRFGGIRTCFASDIRAMLMIVKKPTTHPAYLSYALGGVHYVD